MKLKLVAIFLFQFNLYAFSQSLDSLLNEALFKNPILKSSQLIVEAKKNKVIQSSALPSPVLSFEINQFNFDRANILGNSLSNTISLSQMIPLGGKINAMQRVSMSELLLSRNKLDEIQNDLLTKIKVKYFELWKLENEIMIQKENQEELRRLQNSLDLLYQINKTNQSDVILIQSEIAKGEVELINLERKRNSLIKEINFLIGRENLEQEIFTDKKIKLPAINFTIEQFDSLIFSLNPELKSMQSMIEMNKNEIKATEKELIPDLMISGMIMRMPKGMILTTKYPLPMNGSREEIMFGLMTSINLPFAPWSKKKFTYKIEELENTIKSIEYEKTNMINQMRKEVQNLLLTINSNKDLIQLYEQKVIPSYDNVFNAQLIEFETGRVSINSIIEINRMRLMEKMKYYMLVSEYLMSFAELEKITGQNLHKENLR